MDVFIQNIRNLTIHFKEKKYPLGINFNSIIRSLIPKGVRINNLTAFKSKQKQHTSVVNVCFIVS